MTGAFELTVHAWDITESTRCETPLSDDLVSTLLTFAPLVLDHVSRAGLFDPPWDAWTRIEYPRAIADIAEVGYAAFASDQANAVTARLIVRRVRDLSQAAMDELFPVWRSHGLFTGSPHELAVAEPEHRGHAIRGPDRGLERQSPGASPDRPARGNSTLISRKIGGSGPGTQRSH